MRLAAALLVLSASGGVAAQPAASEPAAPAPDAQPAASAPDSAPPKPLDEMLTGAARADYTLGRSLFEHGDYANAFAKFQSAYEASGDARLLWNMVACTVKMHQYRRSIALLEQLKENGRGVLLPEDWATIAALEQNARALLGTLDIAVSEPDAEVTIDDELVGKTPLSGKVLIDSGLRRIRISKPGFKDHVHTETVKPGAEMTLKIRLEPKVPTGRLSVITSPGGRIALDGKPLGQGRWDGTVPSGHHVLRVTAPGMVPYPSEIVIQDDVLSRIRVDLTPLETPGRVPAWVWIAGGTLVVAAGVIGAVVLLQPSPASPIHGTLGPTERASLGGRW